MGEINGMSLTRNDVGFEVTCAPKMKSCSPGDVVVAGVKGDLLQLNTYVMSGSSSLFYQVDVKTGSVLDQEGKPLMDSSKTPVKLLDVDLQALKKHAQSKGVLPMD